MIDSCNGESRAKSFVSAGRFIGLFALLLWIPIFSPSLPAHLNQWTAQNAASLLHLTGWFPRQTGPFLQVGGFTVQIILECTAYYPLSLWLANLYSLPASRCPKWSMALGGAFLLHGVNTLRIVLLAVLGAHRPEAFSPAHIFSGEIGMPLVVLCLCLAVKPKRVASISSGQPFRFLFRYGVIAALLFIAWAPLQGFYISGGDQLLSALFAGFGESLNFTSNHYWYAQSFNLVLLGALALGTSAPWPKRLNFFATGALSMVLVHLLMRSGNIFNSAWGLPWGLTAFYQLHLIGQYLLPLLFWSWWMRQLRERSLTT